MKDDLHENLSALMDDNLSDQDRERIIEAIARDDDLLNTWSNYHLVRDSLQGQVHDFTTRNLAATISQQLEQEPVILAPRKKQAPQWQKPLAGFAIAASVALVAVLGVRSINSDNQLASVPLAQVEAPVTNSVSPSPEPAPVPQLAPTMDTPASVRFVRAEGDNVPAGARLNSYLVNHNERKNNFGMLPYVRIVGYETRSK